MTMKIQKKMKKYLKKVLTNHFSCAILFKRSRKTALEMPKCRCGGIGRRPGLKIPWENIPYRFDPGHRHQVHIAEWSNPVARRAHNPKVVGSNPASATKKQRTPSGVLLFFVTDCVGQGLNLPPTARDRLPLAASRANNLQTSENTSVKCFREGLTAQSTV